jgi:hypothetical protein
LTLESEQSVHIAGLLCSLVNKTFSATHPPFLQFFKNRGLLNVKKNRKGNWKAVRRYTSQLMECMEIHIWPSSAWNGRFILLSKLLILSLDENNTTQVQENFEIFFQLASSIAGGKGECSPPKRTRLWNLEHCFIERRWFTNRKDLMVLICLV